MYLHSLGLEFDQLGISTLGIVYFIVLSKKLPADERDISAFMSG